MLFRSTTGRSRRCGWFDAALLKRSAQVNGLSGLCITKLDVLDGLSELKLCVGYMLDGERIDLLPLGADDIERCVPIYETLPGWGEEIETATRLEELPTAARDYVKFVEEFVGVPVGIVGVGPGREQTIVRPRPA